MFIALLTLLGCPSPCGDDEVETFDGCSPIGDGPVYDTETLPGYQLRPCDATPGTGLDLEAGCAQGVCVGDTFEDWRAVLGDPNDCDASGTFARCDWDASGLAGSFDDADDNGIPDPGSVPAFVNVTSPAAGFSSGGLGVDVSFACFVQQLGAPEDIQTEQGQVVDLDFVTSGARVLTADFSGQQDLLTPDGFVDLILLGEL